MRIAFTSCCDPVNDAEQATWRVLAEQQPQHLVLLGDNIYMDYKFGDHLENGEPRGKPPAEFSALMHSYYTRQWAVPAFRSAVQAPTVHAIWDDHDFAWNNSRGGEPARGDDFVPPERRWLSRALFEQFRQALVDKPVAYLSNPCADGLAAADLGGIQRTIDLAPGLRLHLLDGRSFRQAAGKDASLLGADQRAQLEKDLLPEPGVNLIASGTTLDDWNDHSDYRWLKEVSKTRRVLVLSGDIHKPRFRNRLGLFGFKPGRWFEATASAMAQPPKVTAVFGRKTGVFGVLDVSATELTITLWRGDAPLESHTIELAGWTLRG